MTVMIDEPRNKRKPWVKWLGIALLVIGILVAIGLVVMSLMSGKKAKKATVHQVALLRPPPPPPPPKPPEKPPEPEVKKEEVKIEDKQPPKETESDQPEGKSLGVDAEGGAGGDGFGLVGNKGGRDLLAGGKGAFAFYTNTLQRYLHEELSRNKALRTGDYRVVVKLWLGKDGSIQRFELVGTTGNPEVDDILKNALSQARPMREAPPENMPQPVKVRITARGMG